MDNKKDDKYYLGKVLDDLKFLIEHTHGKSYNEVEADPVLIDCCNLSLWALSVRGQELV